MKGKKREEEKSKRKKKKRKKEESSQGMEILKFCMNFYDFWYGFYMESKELMVLYGFLGIFMSSKPRV